MNFYFVCPREERSDVAIHLSTAFRGSPQSAGFLRDDKHEFVSRSAAKKQSIRVDRHAVVPRARDDNQRVKSPG